MAKPHRESPQHYQVEPFLFAGEYPFLWDPVPGRRLLEFLVDRGIRTFIDLTTEWDGLEPYEPVLKEIGAVESLALRRSAHPIPDMSIPDNPAVMHRILAEIRQEIATRRGVYVHCWGGIGRTGTVIGAWFREQGLGADEALAKVQRLYSSMPKVAVHPRSPQTVAQRHYVSMWPPMGG